MIDYQSILNKNLVNVFKEILKNIRNDGLSDGNHLYITFATDHKSVVIPKWLQEKHPKEITIVIQYEYYDLKIYEEFFSITLSFNNTTCGLKIGYESLISFADPSANFGLKLQQKNSNNKNKNKQIKKKNINNVIEFSNYKKN